MRIRIVGCLVLLLVYVSAWADNMPGFKHIVFFGDSLSDNGNFYKHSAHLLPKYPPYFEGRFSNGYNWADNVSYTLFSKYNITSDNFAVGGATAVLHNPLNGYLPVTIAMERDDYNLQYLLKDKSDTLYVIWIGGNDYVPGNPNVDQVTTEVVSAIENVVQSLAENKAAEFLLISLPDLSLTPQASISHLGDNYKALVMLHNQKLHNAILNLRAQYPGTKIIEFNFSEHPVLEEIVNSQAYRDEINKAYGVDITNVVDACWQGSLVQPSPAEVKKNLSIGNTLAQEITHSPALSEVYRVQQLALQNTQVCVSPEHYLFWDNLHPTAATHKVLGGILLKQIMDENS